MCGIGVKPGKELATMAAKLPKLTTAASYANWKKKVTEFILFYADGAQLIHLEHVRAWLEQHEARVEAARACRVHREVGRSKRLVAINEACRIGCEESVAVEPHDAALLLSWRRVRGIHGPPRRPLAQTPTKLTAT